MELVHPTAELHEQWLAGHAQWGPGLHEDGFGVLPSDDLASPEGFADWILRVRSEAGTLPLEDADASGSLCRWIVDGDEVLGGIALRWGNTEVIDRAGHIGFGVRPDARGRGVASWALARTVAQAAELGLGHVLLVCETGNDASAATIERAGGELLHGQDEHSPVRRYRITTR